MQLPDSTVRTEPDSKESSSTDTSVVPRSSSVFADCNSEHSDSMIHVDPVSRTKSTTAQVDQEHCDSPSARAVKNARLNPSNASPDLDGSDLFFSPKRQETPLETLSAPDDVERDDFYGDDFDIDDLNDYDFPNYYEEPPPPQNSGAADGSIKEGGPARSRGAKEPTTPPPAPKPSVAFSPGKHSGEGV